MQRTSSGELSGCFSGREARGAKKDQLSLLKLPRALSP